MSVSLCLCLSSCFVMWVWQKEMWRSAATSDIRSHRLDQLSLSLSPCVCWELQRHQSPETVPGFFGFFCRSSRPAAEDDVSPPAPPAQPGLPPSQPAAASLLRRLVKRANQNESQQESGKKLGRNNNLSRLKILYEDWLLVICVSLFYKPTAKEKRRTIDLRSSPKFDRPSSEGAQCFLEL